MVLDGVPHQAVFHYMWANPKRTAAFAIIGFVVDLDELRAHRFGRLAAAGLEPLLNLGADLPRLALRVEDAAGRRITGPDRDAVSLPSASERIDILFFPSRELGNYLAPLPPVASWRLIVRPEAPFPDGSSSGLWLLGAVVGLLLIAVVCAVGVNREAVRLSQLQADFVLNVSHQLRTPLAMLSGAAETLGLERLRSPEKIKHYADIVQAQTGRLSALVDQILHTHTADHPASILPWQRLDLGALVARAAADVQLLADRRAVAIAVDRQSGAVLVDGDPVALEHVILNLLENAVKYGPDAGNEVRVDVRDRRPAGGRDRRRSRRRHRPRRSAAHLREVLPRPRRRPDAARLRPRPGHRARGDRRPRRHRQGVQRTGTRQRLHGVAAARIATMTPLEA